LSRRAKLKQVPLALQSTRIVQVRPWHTWRPASWRLAGALMRAWRPQVVHIQDEIYSFHETRAAVELALQAKQVGARVVVTLHEYHTERPSVTLTDELVALADAVVVQDARNAERCRERTGCEPAAVGWSPANIDPPPQVVVPTADRVVTFGLLGRGKGLEVVHAALRLITQRRPNLTWHVMGPFDPEGNEYHRELKRQFTDPWVVFTGGGAKELAELGFRSALASAAVMLLPFADGSSPRRTTLQAAWAFGLPTITTAPPVVEPAIRHGENCLLVPGSDVAVTDQVAAWAAAIERLLSDSDYRAALSRGSYAAARSHSWQQLGEQHDAIYSKLL
jgi:glycosyltransferase involved in cell wall biosynthesis